MALQPGQVVSQEEFFAPPVIDDVQRFQTGEVVSAQDFLGDSAPVLSTPSEPEKLSFLERFQEDLDKRVAMNEEIMVAVQAGEQTVAEAMLQIAGKQGAGALMDFLGEVVISAGRGLAAITPDSIKEGATGAAVAFMNTEIGQKGLNAATQSVEAYQQFRLENPRAARNIEAVVDIGLILFPVKAKLVAADSGAIGRVGEKVAEKAVKQTAQSKKAFVDDLIKPKQTTAVRTEQVARTTEEGVLKSKQVALSPKEVAIAETVNKIPGVSTKKTLQGNHEAIQAELGKQANTLKSTLLKNDVPISRKELLDAGKVIKTNLKSNPLIVGDAEKSAVKIIRKMDDLVKANKPTASGLLQARKELDVWVRSQKGSNIFDPKQENAISIALREVRESANALIAKKVPDVSVKESLRIQSNLYRAMDNIAPKAGDEAANVLLRAWQNTMRALPIRGEFNQLMALAFGVGGLGASAMFAPIFTKLVLTGLITYATGKAIMSATTKKGIALLLKQTDKAIKTATNPALIKQMRLDRALIVELLKSSNQTSN